MLDLKWIRENAKKVEEGAAAKNTSLNLDVLLKLDTQRRSYLQEVEALKSQRNKASDDISRLKREGQKEAAQKAIESLGALSQNIKNIDAKVGELVKKMDDLMYVIPNIPLDDVPKAAGPEGNKVIRSWEKPKELGFKGQDHLDLASKLGWLSMEKGSKVTGSAFPVYEGKGARLQRALINFMIDRHIENGYQEIWPPALVNRASMTGTGQLPKFEEEMYRLKEDDYFLIPTAEVPVTNLLRDTMINEKELPIKYTAYSPCFRREAGAYGKDTRGLSRLHQFDKVEMVQFVKPEEGEAALEALVQSAEAILQALELPYRVVLLASGDMSFAASKCYDLEVWAPVTGRWFEVSSCSLFGDFQARRANIRFRRHETNKPEFVYTLNGSGVALPRTVLCLLENFQTPEGQVNLPKALGSYLS